MAARKKPGSTKKTRNASRSRLLPAEQVALGQRIREARKEASLSVPELAHRLKIFPNHLYNLERGLYTPSVATLRGLAKELSVSMEYLLDGEP